MDGREVKPMRTKETETITIRTTVTTTIKIERSEETESTTMPTIIVVLDRKGQ